MLSQGTTLLTGNTQGTYRRIDVQLQDNFLTQSLVVVDPVESLLLGVNHKPIASGRRKPSDCRSCVKQVNITWVIIAIYCDSGFLAI